MTAMLDEIREQPDALRHTLEYLQGGSERLRSLDCSRFRNVLLIGRGTSDNACNYAQYVFPAFAGRLATSFSPSVATMLAADVPLEGTLAIAVSQSGRTAEIIDSMMWAKEQGAGTIAITNVPGSELAERADLALVTQAGIEHAVPATKSYSTALLTIAFVAATMGDDAEFLQELQHVPELVATQLDQAHSVQESVALLLGADTAIVAGRGFGYGVAKEIALKLTETSSMNARGMSTADLMHGPVAALVKDLPLILLNSDPKSAFARGLQFIGDRARNSGCRVLTLGPASAEVSIDHHLQTANLPEPILPFAQCVLGQLLAEAHATHLGLDPDQPNGLNKVTETV